MDWLLKALGVIGNTLDLPGSSVRDLIAGENPLDQWTTPFSGENRASGRRMLEQLGLLGENRKGLDLGDVAGFGAEMLLDPTNLIGGGLAARTLSKAGKAKAANKASEAMRAMGAMPEEVAALTKAVDDAGRPLKTYHGTGRAFGQYSTDKFDSAALYGPGVYTTDNPQVSSGYALAKGLLAGEGDLGRSSANVRMHMLDARNPLDIDAVYAADELPDRARELVDGADGLTGQQVFDAIRSEGVGNAGFDSITHTGGVRMGKDPHRVWIAMDPSQVYSPYVAPALLDVPDNKRLLMALGLHNLLSRGFA